MPTIKDIKFQYAMLLQDDAEGKTKEFDFEAWVDRMNTIPYPEKIKSVNTKLVRLDKCIKRDKNHLMGVRFLGLRDSNIPYKVPREGEAVNLDIAADEYIGESMHIVYDVDSHYYMLQINGNSVRLNSIAAYINLTLLEGENPVYFRTFHQNINTLDWKRRKYTSIEIGFANTDNIPTGALTSLGGMLNTAYASEARTAKITISTGYSKKKQLNNAWAIAAIQEVVQNINLFTTAKIRYKKGDSNRGTPLNLLDLVVTSELSIPIEARKTINFDKMIQQMKEEYLRKKQSLNKLRYHQ